MSDWLIRLMIPPLFEEEAFPDEEVLLERRSSSARHADMVDIMAEI